MHNELNGKEIGVSISGLSIVCATTRRTLRNEGRSARRRQGRQISSKTLSNFITDQLLDGFLDPYNISWSMSINIIYVRNPDYIDNLSE